MLGRQRLYVEIAALIIPTQFSTRLKVLYQVTYTLLIDGW
jgi:hypothetical protein